MNKTMILAVGGAGCNMAETIMRVANAHWLRRLHIFSLIQIWNAFQNWVKRDLKR